MPGSIDLIVSTVYIGLTIWIAYWLRLYTLFYLDARPLTKNLVLEFIATAELCGACFELIISKSSFHVKIFFFIEIDLLILFDRLEKKFFYFNC